MNNHKKATFYVILLVIVTLGGLAFLSPSASALQGGGQIQVPTTKNDFFLFGTQPNTDTVAFAPVLASSSCSGCHGNYNNDVAPFDTWIVSMMGQAARDPVWIAARRVAMQDANFAGDFAFVAMRLDHGSRDAATTQVRMRCSLPLIWKGSIVTSVTALSIRPRVH